MSAVKLTPAQKKHLVELLAEKWGQPLYWRPYGSGEYRVARKLKQLGLVEGDMHSYDGGVCLTDEGRRVALEIAAASVASPGEETTS